MSYGGGPGLHSGILVGGPGVVTDNVVSNASEWGLELDPSVGYAGNVLHGNNGGNVNPQVSSGVEIGTNLCGGATTCP